MTESLKNALFMCESTLERTKTSSMHLWLSWLDHPFATPERGLSEIWSFRLPSACIRASQRLWDRSFCRLLSNKESLWRTLSKSTQLQTLTPKICWAKSSHRCKKLSLHRRSLLFAISFKLHRLRQYTPSQELQTALSVLCTALA